MDDRRFDALTRAFASNTSRRTAIKGIFSGLIGGVAVGAARMGHAGAQITTPCTVDEDCELPDACTVATCQDLMCHYEGGCNPAICLQCDNQSGQCVSFCSDCETCESGDELGTCVSACGPCSGCFDGECQSTCQGCDTCVGGVCTDTCDGLCCGTTCSPDGECCNDVDCDCCEICSQGQCMPADGECCTVQGNACGGLGLCDCCEGLHCCDGGDLGVCSECCDDSDCPDCQRCVEDGICLPFVCEDGNTCCGGHTCVPEDECCKGVGDSCGVLEVTASDGESVQLDCCDGLVCCGVGDSSICAECCVDSDCPGGYCQDWECHWPDDCDSDGDCPHRTCCCANGSCSRKCCDPPPHHPKPPKPTHPGSVTTLPATGAGQNADSSGLFGVAALGGAAALIAAKKLRASTSEADSNE